MSKNQSSGRRDNQQSKAVVGKVEGSQELEGSALGQQSGDTSGEQGEVKTGSATLDKPIVQEKEKPKAPTFASNKAPDSDQRLVKMFTQFVGEYAKGNTSRQMDQAKAKQVTRGLCTAFHTLGKLNGNDVKTCLSVLDKAIRENAGNAFSEGTMFRHAPAVQHQRLYVDVLNLAKRYVSLGEGKSNIAKVVDVEATAEHFTPKVVQLAIIDFYK